MARSTPPSKSTLPIGRREALTALGTGVLGSLSGCKIPTTILSPPPLTNGWIRIYENGDVDTLLQFDGNVEQMIATAPFTKEDLIENAIAEGYQVEAQSVSIRGAENVPSKQSLSARIHDFASVKILSDNVTQFRSPGFHIAKKAYSVNIGGFNYKLQIPTKDPTYVVRYPSSYQYKLPTAHTKFLNQGLSLDRNYHGLFKYSGFNKDRTFPALTHRDSMVAVNARVFDSYRMHIYRKLGIAVDLNNYEQQAKETLQQGITDLGWAIGKKGAIMIAESPLSTDGYASTAKDYVDAMTDPLTNDYNSLVRAFDRLSDYGQATMNNIWMTVAYKQLVKLFHHAEEAAWGYNPAWVSAPQSTYAQTRLSKYIEHLRNEQDLIRSLRQDRPFRSAVTLGSYFEQLYQTINSFLNTADNTIGDVVTNKLQPLEHSF